MTTKTNLPMPYLTLTIKGYECRCPTCNTTFTSKVSMYEAEKLYEKHWRKKHAHDCVSEALA